MDHDLLKRYAQGDCSKEEQRLIEDWLYDNSSLTHKPLSGEDEAIREQAIHTINNRINTPFKFKIQIFKYASAAAVLLLIFAVGLWYQRNNHEPIAKNAISWKVIDVPDGEKATIKLTDGSTISLNGGTTFSYPSRFENQRLVKLLKGDAFFVVAKDSKHPFVVQTNNQSNIRVLGTRFNVKNNSFSSTLEITLNSGKISFERTGQKSQLLKPGEQLLYNLKSHSISNPVTVDTLLANAWIENRLIFKDTPIKQVFREIEQAYGVKFVAEASFGHQFMNAEFTREPLSRLLIMISKTSGLKFRQANKIIYVNP